MQYFEFSNLKLPLTCIAGFSYVKSANIVNTRKLSCKCTGITPLQVQVQMTLSNATCYESNFIELAKAVSSKRPNKSDEPSNITIAGDIIIPQLKFMLISTNITYQSDRLGNLQEIQANWTLAGSRVVKDENRSIELKSNDELTLPKVTLHCKGKSIECAQDISISELRLNGLKGSIQLVLADTYTKADRDSWMADVNDSEDSYFTIENYGDFYIKESSIVADNWLSFTLTKFSKEWYQKRTETLISDDGSYTLNDVFKGVKVQSKATFDYLKYDDTPFNMLFALQDSLGYNIGVRGNTIVLYDTPDSIPAGDVTYDYYTDNDLMTVPITKVIMRDGVHELTAGDDKGETYFVNAICRLEDNSTVPENVLKYANFNRNMLVLTIPYEQRISIGCMVNANVDGKIIHCVCTEYEIDFLSNSMTIELHYVER